MPYLLCDSLVLSPPPMLATSPGPVLLPVWSCTHVAGNGGERCSPCQPPAAAGHVDNFLCCVVCCSAEKMGSVDKVRKCAPALNIPDNVRKVVHVAHFVQRTLC